MSQIDAYAEYVKWRDVSVSIHGCREFIVMWSDYTWSLFQVPGKEYWLTQNGTTKTYKQIMGLNKIVSQKMTRLQTVDYIHDKIKELEELEKAQ